MQDEDPQELIKKLEKLVGGHVELEKLIRQITREEVHKVVQKGAINQEHRRIEPRKPPSRTCSKCGKTVAWGFAEALGSQGSDSYCRCGSKD